MKNKVEIPGPEENTVTHVPIPKEMTRCSNLKKKEEINLIVIISHISTQIVLISKNAAVNKINMPLPPIDFYQSFMTVFSAIV